MNFKYHALSVLMLAFPALCAAQDMPGNMGRTVPPSRNSDIFMQLPAEINNQNNPQALSQQRALFQNQTIVINQLAADIKKLEARVAALEAKKEKQ